MAEGLTTNNRHENYETNGLAGEVRQHPQGKTQRLQPGHEGLEDGVDRGLDRELRERREHRIRARLPLARAPRDRVGQPPASGALLVLDEKCALLAGPTDRRVKRGVERETASSSLLLDRVVQAGQGRCAPEMFQGGNDRVLPASD